MIVTVAESARSRRKVVYWGHHTLQDVPDILGGVAEFTAGHAGAEAVVADGDGVVFERIGKIVAAFRHGTDEDTNALIRIQSLDVISNADNLSIEREGDFSAFGRKVIRDWVLDDLEELLLRIDRPYGEFVKKLDHEASKTLECARNTHGRADFDQYTFSSVDVDLQLPSLVDGRIQEGQEALFYVLGGREMIEGMGITW